MNPFREMIVSDPWRTTAADVPEIQAEVFQEIMQGIQQVRTTKRSAALLIHGGAGAGKTHLLSRLRTQLTLKAPTATDRDECLFVWVRLQTSPRMIWRHVRRTLVEDWFRPVRGESSQFARVLFHRFADIRIAEGDLEPWYEYMLDHHPEGLEALLEQIADTLYLDRNTTVAFHHLVFNRHTRDLRAWLGGDSLPEQALARLDLSQEEGTDEEREHEARRVVLMLCRLAGDGLPVVLSLDQVEALQTSSTDREGLFAFGQLVSTLHDETSNVLIVSCVQSAFATELKDKSRGADYDRMTSLGTRSLATLTRTEAEKLVAARRDIAGVALPTSDPLDPLWPLEPADFHRLAALDELTPRRLLSTCAERYESWSARGTTAMSTEKTDTSDASLEAFLEDEWKNRCATLLTTNAPERTEEIIRHGLPLMLRLLSLPWRLAVDDRLLDIHLQFEAAHDKVGISLCAQSNMRNVGEQFKRLKAQWSLRLLTRLVVIQDSRLPLTKGAKVARQTLDELQTDGAVVVLPTQNVLVCLDAIRDLLSDAKSGDLSFHGDTVSSETVERWLSQNVPDDVHAFLSSVMGNA